MLTGYSRRLLGLGLVAILALVACTAAPRPSATPLASLDTDSKALYERALVTLYSASDRFAYPAAVDALTDLIERYPTFGAARLHAAYAASKVGRYDAMAEHLEQASRYPASLSPRERLWLAALSQRADDEPFAEVDAWRKVTTMHPGDRWAWYELASTLSRVERYREAADAAGQAIAQEPNTERWEASWLFYLRSKALYRSGQYAAAIRAANPGQANRTTWRSTFYRRALAEARLDPTLVPALVDEYRAISAAEGRNNAAYTEANIALFYYELGDFAAAVDFAKASWDAQPSGYAAWSLAFALIESGKADAALAFIDQSATAFETNSFLQVARGWALYRLGRLDDSLDALNKAAELSSRWQYLIDFALRTVQRANAQPDLAPAPPIAWLG
ncbi:MAG: hypothetical protein AAGC71_14465 [Pseudomonadota bacterium]